MSTNISAFQQAQLFIPPQFSTNVVAVEKSMSYQQFAEFLKALPSAVITVSYKNDAMEAQQPKEDAKEKAKQNKKYISSRMVHYNDSIKMIFDNEVPPDEIQKKNIKGKTMDDVLEELRKEKISYRFAPYFIKKNTNWKRDDAKCCAMKLTLGQDFRKLLEYCENNNLKLPSINYFLHHRSTAHGYKDVLPFLKNMKTLSSVEKYSKHYEVCFSS